MKCVTIVLGDYPGSITPKGTIIGVDYGAFICCERGIEMDVACGDFDSVSDLQLIEITDCSRELHKLDPIKDITDFTYAYGLCDDYDEIFVLGGLGRRRDHEYVHIMHVIEDPRLVFIDELNRIQSLIEGTYKIKKGDYDYISFIPLGDSEITLNGFKYPLNQQVISCGDKYLTSNEIELDVGEVILKGSSILLLQTKK